MRLLALFLAACGSKGPCPSFPDDPQPADGTLSTADTCGYWSLAVGEHLVVNVLVADDAATCDAALSAGLAQPSQPIFSNFGEDGPRWTFDFVGEAAEDPATVDVTCTDGTTFDAEVAVTP